MANQLWCIDFFTPPTPSHHPSQTPCPPWISYAIQKPMLDSCKMVEKQFEAFHTFLWHFFPSLKQDSVVYRSSKLSDYIFEIYQAVTTQAFSRVYSNCCCRCSFESEIIKIGQSSHKVYSNNILNSRVYDNFKCPSKKSLETYCMHLVYIYVQFICILLKSTNQKWQNIRLLIVLLTTGGIRIFIPFTKVLVQKWTSRYQTCFISWSQSSKVATKSAHWPRG